MMNDLDHLQLADDRRQGAQPAGRARSRSNRSAPIDAPPAFDHGAVSRFNAWFFHTFDRYINHISQRHKQAAFAGISAEVVVELGAGVGANLDYLAKGTRLIAIEPALQMHDRLRERAAQAGLDLELLAHGAETLPLADAAYDEVLCSLVLCTAEDPDRILSEVRRILRPGGRFRFVEHVAAPPWSPRRWLQRAIRRPWAWLFEGCQLDRETAARVRAAGFSDVRIQNERFHRSLFVPVNTTIWGVATR
jgi:ubiquinone/menaquinone biosynthesis C-methylase UbiE